MEQAQKVSEKEAPALLADAPRKGGSPLGVQFFGTGQVAWVSQDTWGEGISRNYYGKEKKQKKYKLAMQQVCLSYSIRLEASLSYHWWHHMQLQGVQANRMCHCSVLNILSP